jgi:hypothetical protein
MIGEITVERLREVLRYDPSTIRRAKAASGPF